MLDRFEKYVSPEPNTGCWLWTGSTTPSGYGLLRVDYVLVQASHVAWELFKGHRNSKLKVLHRCDNGSLGCVNPDHLWQGTQAENVADMISKGRDRKARGEQASKSKLTEAQVLEMRRRRDEGATFSSLGNAFGVAENNARKATLGLTWKHIGSPDHQ